MADEVVRTGTLDDDGTGDTIRQAFALINYQFGVTRSLLSGRGTWTTGTAYKATPHREWVIQGGTAYVCAVDHTAGTFATDLAAGKWISADAVQLVADLYNVFDKQTPYNFNPAAHSSTFMKPQSFFAPRRFQLAARVQF